MDASRRWGPLALTIGLLLALAAGAALRLAYPGVMEWKADEQWSFFHARAMLAGGGWPPEGMPSSVGPPNPGLSLWVFTGLMALSGATTPPELARAVQLLNIAALAAFALFVAMAPAKERREPWAWALALWAVNPASMIFERKIWPPSVLPLGAVALVWAWWYRRHPAAAFAWGALGALMAQIHVGVAFFALALALWTYLGERPTFPWRGWLAGSVVGALPAIPWALALLRQGAVAHARGHHPSAGFYERWVSQFFGYSAHYDLGPHDFGDYLRGPGLDHLATHLMEAAQVALILVAAVALVRAAMTVWRGGLAPLRAIFLGDSPETVLITASLWGYGGFLTLLTFVGAGSYRHYMVVIAPIIALWTAMAVFYGGASGWRPRAMLAALVILQASMSLGLLDYIDRKGVIGGDFGASWDAQQTPPVN